MQSDSSLTSKLLTFTVLSTSVGFISAGAALAHDPEEHCTAIIASVEEAGFADKVAVTCENGAAVISSNTYPDHELMTGIVGTNEQVPVPAPGYDAPIPLAPVLGNTPHTRDSALGVAVNGVPIFDYTGGGEMTEEDLYHYQTQHDTLQTQQLDVCGGHAGRGDDYHYHVKPVCMIAQMENAGNNAIIGWAFDGFPIYGDNNPDGTAIPDGVLDVCNGQPDEAFGYRYHTSEGAPYIVQCLMGEVADIRELPRVSPLVDAKTGHGTDPGRPPRGGVENLIFTEGTDGTRSMDYSYEGEDYYIRYAPSGTPDCYLFETRTVTNGGEVVSGEYCR
ncbi:YHYH protein [Tateyamaria omphalii]|uniref:YHYH protein n=1 Tax=Tateyamaria omphalii TaxID=299262 RepID=UPI001C99FC24|nr:YHYH protein [Tateyamaria omphalii]MBY5935093.1 YHYH protein [Tateyamaria omphalii]